MTAVFWFRVAAAFGLSAVALGAFGAHGLRGQLARAIEAETHSQVTNRTVSAQRRLDVFETGVRYQMYHALALFTVAWLAARSPGELLPQLAGWMFVAGIVLFSGSLYGIGFTGMGALGAITPLGGLALMAGWIVLITAAPGVVGGEATNVTP